MDRKQKSFLVVSIVILVCLCAAGCQPTPEESVVINKADGKLEKAIAQTAQPEGSYEADEKWIESFSKQNVTVNVDAKITAPDVTAYPVIEVAPIEFGQIHIDKAIEVFLADAKISNKNMRTKGAIEEELLRWKRIQADIEAGNPPPDDERPVSEQIDECEQNISRLEQEYQSAPETQIDDEPEDAQLQQTEFGNQVHLYASFADGASGDLYVNNTKNNGFNQTVITNSEICFVKDTGQKNDFLPIPYSKEGIVGVKLSKEQAEEFAINIMKKLEIDNVALDSVKIANYYERERIPEIMNAKEAVPTDKQAYMFTFVGCYEGIPATLVKAKSETMSSDNAGNEQYSYVLRPEKIEVLVNDDGVVFFLWDNPCTMIRTENKNVSMLSFEKIEERFRTQVFIKNFGLEESLITINITEIKLGYRFLPIKDAQNAYRVLPVWDFIGTENEVTSWGEQYDNSDYVSYVTLNAIDGSNINRTIGY